MNFLIQIFTSPITNVVLTLLIIFQWFWQRAKEQSVIDNLFSVRRIVGRTINYENNVLAQKSHDLVDVLDATLATLGARLPFTERINEVLDYIKDKNRLASKEKLEKFPNEIEEVITSK